MDRQVTKRRERVRGDVRVSGQPLADRTHNGQIARQPDAGDRVERCAKRVGVGEILHGEREPIAAEVREHRLDAGRAQRGKHGRHECVGRGSLARHGFNQCHAGNAGQSRATTRGLNASPGRIENRPWGPAGSPGRVLRALGSRGGPRRF